jgi:hypothetical protein
VDAVNWDRFADQLARRHGEGKTVQFWWRDDDAAQPTPALERLLGISESRRVPVALAVVPDLAVPELFDLIHEKTAVLQHGTDHRNRAGPGEKKTEFPAREPDAAALARLSAARERLRWLAGERALPVLVPPWNRIRGSLLSQLPGIGIVGLSAYGKSTSSHVMKQVNTHVDIVAWRQGRRFIGEGEALAAAVRLLGGGAPIGWLTHHAVHDAAAWGFLERLLGLESVRWASAQGLFSYTAPAHG